jgi:hypothetical protein
MFAPCPLAHHSLLWNPFPANKHAIRTGGLEDCDDSSPQTDADSSQGNATDTPTPRKNIRRERLLKEEVVNLDFL